MEINKSQVGAYVVWVNAQLKKKPGTREVKDLRTDMQDGVALADLIYIVAGERLDGVSRYPSCAAHMIENVEAVIQFMTRNRIRMHHTTATDIVEGNLKAIMRLILALAAHFKPNSVKQSVHPRTQPHRTPSIAGMVQTAAVALADARRDAQMTVPKPRRPTQLDRRDVTARSPAGPRGVVEGGLSSPPSSSKSSIPESPPPSPWGHEFGGSPSRLPKSRSDNFDTRQEAPWPGVVMDQGTRAGDGIEGLPDVFVQSLTQEHEDMKFDIEATRDMLVGLQELLLTGQVSESLDGNTSLVAEGSTLEEELAIIKSKLQHSEELNRNLREEVCNLKNECMQLQGVRSGLQQRLSEQESSFLVIKAELLRAGFSVQTLESTKAELEQKLEEKDKHLFELRRALAQRERDVDHFQHNFQQVLQEREEAANSFKGQVHDLSDRLNKIGDTELSLSARVMSQDRKMARLESLINHGHGEDYPVAPPRERRSVGSEDEFSLVRDSLRCLRNRFPGDDPQHQTIDALESSISGLMERLYNKEESGNASRHLSLDSEMHHNSPMPSAHSFHGNRLGHSSISYANGGHHSTKVLYFTDRTVTPFMCNIAKRLGEITLRDIKAIVNRPGAFRYHFKAMDPEFGTVKEEIAQDEMVVPGWEGKIVAWVEEDGHE